MSDWPDAMEWYDKVTALEAELERLKAERDYVIRVIEDVGRERDELELINERLMAALQIIADTDGRFLEGDDTVNALARRALENKP